MTSTPTSTTTPPGLRCPACGYLNSSYHSVCQSCGTHLVRPEDSNPPVEWRATRPGCLTGWLLLFGGYIVLSGVMFFFDMVSQATFNPEDGMMLVIDLGGMLVAFVILAGLWQMRAWARVPAIALHVVVMGLFLAGQIYALSDYTSRRLDNPAAGQDTAQNNAAIDICSGIVWLGVQGAAIYWITAHRDRFDPPPERPEPV